MIELSRCRWSTIAGMMLPIFFLFIEAPVSGGERSEKIRLANINPTWEDDAVVITYSLIAPLDKTYEVRLIMQRESDSTFQYFPKTVTGDIGKGKFAGEGRKIRWAHKQDASKGFAGDDYYFVITVKKAGGRKAWLYSTLAATALGGGYILKDKIFPPHDPPRPTELASPPGRP
jgi:hypothetical protein